jgi:hypothetical protein
MGGEVGVEVFGKKAKVRQKGVWFIESGIGARSAGSCYVRIHLSTWDETVNEGAGVTHDCNFIAYHLHIWPSEMLQCHNPSQTCTIHHVPRIC